MSAGVRFFFYWTSLPGHTVGLCVSLTASCILHTLALRDKNTWSVFISKNWSHQIGFTRWKDHRWNIVWPLEKSLVVKLDNITVKLLHNNHTKRQSPNKSRVYINWKSKPFNARILLFQIWRFLLVVIKLIILQFEGKDSCFQTLIETFGTKNTSALEIQHRNYIS